MKSKPDILCTNRRTMVESLRRYGFNIGVEVGVRTGWFSKYMLDHTNMTIYSVDPWEDNSELIHSARIFEECQQRLEPYGDRSVMVKQLSLEAAPRFADSTVDFIYIDALHTYEAVMSDLLAWWPKLRRGRIMAGHDYNPTKWPGVCQAVDEFVKENQLMVTYTGIVGNALESCTGDIAEFDGDEQSWVILKE